MEIILKNLVCTSVNEEKKLNNVTYTFFKENITFVSGLSGRLLRDLLIGKKQKQSGQIMLQPTGTYKDIGYLSNNPLKEFKCKNLYDEMLLISEKYELNYSDNKTKITAALKMANLDDSILGRSFNTLSTTELKKAQLALILYYNPKVYILDYFEKGFNYKDIDYIKRLLKKLKNKYEKNIIIVSDNIGNFLDTLDCFVIFEKGSLVFKGSNKDLYSEELYKYIRCPKIIEFIKMVKDKNINLSNYLDMNELIKGIYRSVEGK